MKKTLLFIFTLGFLASAKAQPWTYDFGTATGTTSSQASAGNITHTTSGSFLPAPSPSGTIVRIRHQASAGIFETVTSGASFITGSALRQALSTSGSGTKLSIYNIPTSSKYFDLAFNFKINSASVGGSFFVTVGAESSAAASATFFNNSTNLALADTALTYVRFNIDPTTNHILRVGSFGQGGGSLAQTSVNTTLNSSIASITNSTEHLLRILCNASNNSVQYTIVNNNVSTNYTITPRSYHIWFDNNILYLTESNPNFVSTNQDIEFNRLNAFGIFGNSAPNASVILDNFSYNVTLPNLVVLPVSLTSFTARKSNNQIQLAWSTASESNNSHFEIERSVNGTDFVKIGERKGAGNSSSVLNYSFIDNNPASGTNYYRLKQVDFDGKFEYSDIQAASLASTEELALKYLGGQNDNQVKFEINTLKSSNGSLVIYDLSGRRIAKQDVLLKQGSNFVSLSMLNLNTGIYFATCQVDGKLVSQKFVK